jgi:hypothetical protein
MAQQTINIGSAPNDTTGDPLRTAFSKCNDNFSELYGAIIPPQGRLTLASATPIMRTTQSAKNTIYYTPYLGNRCPVYYSGAWHYLAFSEISTTTTDTTKNPSAIGASKVNDWFVWYDAGTARLCHGPDWTNSTTRSAGTALTLLNGIWVNNAAITNAAPQYNGTYVGTTLSNTDSLLYWYLGGTAGSPQTTAILLLWNMYNRALVSVWLKDTGGSYTYASGTVRGVRGTTAGGVMSANFILGQVEDAVVADYTQRIDTPTAGNVAAITIGVNSITAGFNARNFVHGAFAGQANVISNHAEFFEGLSLGYNYLQGLESSDVGTNTFNAESSSTLYANLRM